MAIIDAVWVIPLAKMLPGEHDIIVSIEPLHLHSPLQFHPSTHLQRMCQPLQTWRSLFPVLLTLESKEQ